MSQSDVSDRVVLVFSVYDFKALIGSVSTVTEIDSTVSFHTSVHSDRSRRLRWSRRLGYDPTMCNDG